MSNIASRVRTEFYKNRMNLECTIKEVADAIGLSVTSYARIEEGVYQIGGTDNNPKVEAVAKFYGMPFSIADAQAHLNLADDEWHYANTTITTLKSSRNYNGPSKRVYTPRARYVSTEDSLDTSAMTVLASAPVVSEDVTVAVESCVDNDAIYEKGDDIVMAKNVTTKSNTTDSVNTNDSVVTEVLNAIYGKVDVDTFMHVSSILSKFK